MCSEASVNSAGSEEIYINGPECSVLGYECAALYEVRQIEGEGIQYIVESAMYCMRTINKKPIR